MNGEVERKNQYIRRKTSTGAALSTTNPTRTALQPGPQSTDLLIYSTVSSSSAAPSFRALPVAQLAMKFPLLLRRHDVRNLVHNGPPGILHVYGERSFLSAVLLHLHFKIISTITSTKLSLSSEFFKLKVCVHP